MLTSFTGSEEGLEKTIDIVYGLPATDKNNKGLRIDHFLLSSFSLDCLNEVYVDEKPRKKSKTSDHAPIIASFSFQ